MTVLKKRDLLEAIVGQPASDGDGVKLTRVFGGHNSARFDPFLMLDEFGSDSAADYIGGFPSHPHRGFETVTYMLEGRMLHEDHMGNRGLLEPGGVQWMTAGRGIIHSEMPQQDHGSMRGFQLWVNLPAAEKMQPAHYQDLPANAIPSYPTGQGGSLRLIAGAVTFNGTDMSGAITGKTTEPLYLDLHLAPGEQIAIPVPDLHTVLSYVYEGEIQVQGEERQSALKTGRLGRFGHGNQIDLTASDQGARLLIIAGKPIGEPVVQYGPFVMNSEAEIHQAVRDFQQGTLAS